MRWLHHRRPFGHFTSGLGVETWLVDGGGEADARLAAVGDEDLLTGGGALHVPAEVVAELVRPDGGRRIREVC